MLSVTAETFPIYLWGQLIPYVENKFTIGTITRKSKKTAYAHLYEPHNYSALPFLPIGTEALIHENSTRRRTLVEHYKKAYVIGTLYEQYRCWNPCVNKKRAPRVSGTVFFLNKYTTNPTVTPKDEFITAATNLAYALKNKIPHHLKE